MVQGAAILQSIINRLKPRSLEQLGGYRVFTREYDVVCEAGEIDRLLGPLGRAAREGLSETWATFTETATAAKLGVGGLALESATRVRSAITAAQLQSTRVALLMDLSGSMRGEKLLLAAAAIYCAHDYLGGLEISPEILGFTTRAWQGGRPQQDWYRLGSPPYPGRLNEVLHIIFKQTDDRGQALEIESFGQIFRKGLLKENIDGEAIQWSLARLRTCTADRRILIVLTDGAPVDRATMTANGTPYLRDHLKLALAEAAAEGDAEVAAVGIGHDVSEYYSMSERANSPAEIGGRLITLLERVLTAPTTSPA